MNKVNFLDETGALASMVIMSNLSDLTYKFGQPYTESIEFMKWLIMTLDGDLNQRINSKKCAEAFTQYRKEYL